MRTSASRAGATTAAIRGCATAVEDAASASATATVQDARRAITNQSLPRARQWSHRERSSPPEGSSPSEGSATWHAVNQRAIVDQVFEEKTDREAFDRVLSKQV